MRVRNFLFCWAGLALGCVQALATGYYDIRPYNSSTNCASFVLYTTSNGTNWSVAWNWYNVAAGGVGQWVTATTNENWQVIDAHNCPNLGSYLGRCPQSIIGTNGNGNAGIQAVWSGANASTNCYWQADVKWTNTAMATWALVGVLLTDADGDVSFVEDQFQTVGGSDPDPNLSGYSQVAVPPGGIFQKTFYFPGGGNSPFEFVAPGGTATDPTWQVGNQRDGNMIPDVTGLMVQHCVTNSVPTNAPSGTPMDVGLTITNKVNTLTNLYPNVALPPGPVGQTQSVTKAEMSQLAQVIAESNGMIEKAIRESQEQNNATAEQNAQRINWSYGMGTNMEGTVTRGITNLVDKGIYGTNLFGINTNALANELSKGTNAAAIGTNWWGWGFGTNLAALGTNTWGWGTNENGQGYGTNGGGGAFSAAAASDGGGSAGTAPAAGWGVLDLGWNGWKLDLKGVLSGEALEDPNVACDGFNSGMGAQVTNWRWVVKNFIIFTGLAMVVRLIFLKSHETFFQVVHVTYFNPASYTVAGTVVPGAGEAERLAKAALLAAALLALPSIVMVFINVIGAYLGGLTVSAIMASVSTGYIAPIVENIPGAGNVLYLLQEWLPIGHLAVYGFNYVAACMALEAGGATLALFCKAI